jgi:hypothetical protein
MTGRGDAGLTVSCQVHASWPICWRRPVDKRCITGAREQFRDAGVLVPRHGVRILPAQDKGNHPMPKEEARESNNVFELNAGERKPIDKGFRK